MITRLNEYYVYEKYIYIYCAPSFSLDKTQPGWGMLRGIIISNHLYIHKMKKKYVEPPGNFLSLILSSHITW